MLRSLTIRNFVLIEDAVLEFGPGLTVVSGETGAGKTLFTQALELLLGERAADGLIGLSGDEALVQAVFEVSEEELARVPPQAAEMALLQPGELIASRRLHRGGRHRAFLNEVTVTLSTLGHVAGALLAFSGQNEHRRLMQPAYQREVLDAFAGPEAATALGLYREAYEEERAASRRLDEARESAGRLRQERELLGFQVAELAAAGLSIKEEEELVREQRRLSRAEELAAGAKEAGWLLNDESDSPDAVALVSQARARLAGLAGVDDELDQAAALLDEVALLLDEGGRQLRSYAEKVELDPERLSVVEERLRLYSSLSRKYARPTDELVAFLAAGQARLLELEGAEENLSWQELRRADARRRAEELAERLSEIRRVAAPRLESAIENELADLGMPETRVVVQLSRRGSAAASPGGARPGQAFAETRQKGDGDLNLGPCGLDEVDFLLAPNPGLPPRPLAKTASGGELSRTLVALKAALAGFEGPETLVFDEIDAGVGGRTATAVGRKLWELSRDNQLIAVTHLPQVAAFAGSHYLIEKEPARGGTATRLIALDARASLEELCRMMGGEPGDPAALAHAQGLKDRAAAGLLD